MREADSDTPLASPRENGVNHIPDKGKTNMTSPNLNEPIISADQQQRKRTWFRIVGTLQSGKKLTLRRRSMNSYSHVALYARPGADNQPEAYFWRLTNVKAPKTFREGLRSTKWWLLKLIPIVRRG
jgi:hypothetical protein